MAKRARISRFVINEDQKNNVSAVARILELEADGIAMSRNRHFELFQKRENRAALEVWRHVAAVRRSLFKYRTLGEVQLTLAPLDDTHLRLIAEVEEISARLEWRLHAGEIGILLRHPDVRAWFDQCGIETPAASAEYMKGEAAPD